MGAFFNRPRREIVIDLLHHLSADGVDEARSDIIDDLRREVSSERDLKIRSNKDSTSPCVRDECDCSINESDP